MRLLPLLMTLLIFVSCGKNGGSRSAPPPVVGDSGDAQLEEDACVACSSTNSGTSSDTSTGTSSGTSTSTIIADGSSVDLLDSIIDVPVQVTSSSITFSATKMAVAEGDRISCKTEVAAGESYEYSLSGNKLIVQTANGQLEMTRLNEDGEGIIGTWMWKGKGDAGMHMIRTMSIVNNSRVIMKTHCEM